MSTNEFHQDILTRFQNKLSLFMQDLITDSNVFEGRHSVEEQLSEEYQGRFLIELIQNADDACGQQGRICLVVRTEPSPRLVVLNTGKGFTPTNFKSLCTLGLTDKNPEEAIGNKGLGFRSVLAVCESPIIYSSKSSEGGNGNFDGYCFRFAPNELRQALQAASKRSLNDGDVTLDIAGTSFSLLKNPDASDIASLKASLQDHDTLERLCKILPVYELPIPVEPEDILLPWAKSVNAVTAVVLDLLPSTEQVLQRALAELQTNTFLFLRKARSISVFLDQSECRTPCHLVEFERDIPSSGDVYRGSLKVKYHDRSVWSALCGKDVNDLTEDSTRWLFTKKTLSRSNFAEALLNLPERWHSIDEVDVEVAVPLSKTIDGRFSIYLPTKTPTGTGAWVNAPFYGKIDRTHINWELQWNALLRDTAVSCVIQLVKKLSQTPTLESALAILQLLGIQNEENALAEAQILSDEVKQLVIKTHWVLCEPDTKRNIQYLKLADITLPEDLTWDTQPVYPLDDISCREKIYLRKPHPGLEENEAVIRNTADIYDINTRTPSDEDLVKLAEIAIQSTDKDTRDSNWWNSLYRWLGQQYIGYEALIGKRLVWTQTSVKKVEKTSKIFSSPRQSLIAEDDELQKVLTTFLPNALKKNVAFLHPNVDLNNEDIRRFLIHGSGQRTLVREYRTELVADFILNDISDQLRKSKRSKRKTQEAAEVFAWTFLLWRQMRGERTSVDWNKLLIPTTNGWHPANLCYAGKAWIGDEGEDLEQVFKGANPSKPFLSHPKNLLKRMPVRFRKLIDKHKLQKDLHEFVIQALKVWTVPRLIVVRATRQGGYRDEFCTYGSNYQLNVSSLESLPEELNLPIDRMIWDRYLRRIATESRDEPYYRSSRYVLNEVAFIEEIDIESVDNREALARCIGRGWDRFYNAHARTNVKRHPGDRGNSIQWHVTGFVVEQLRRTKWLPARIWGTGLRKARPDQTGEITYFASPRSILKVNKDLLGAGSGPTYSLLPHIHPSVEQSISSDLCKKIGITRYSPQIRDVERPLHALYLLSFMHRHLPRGREHLLVSLWQRLFDAIISRQLVPDPLKIKPKAMLGFVITEHGVTNHRWIQDDIDHIVWVNNNDDCLSLLPAGTYVAYIGNNKEHFDSRAELLRKILPNADIRLLSELRTIERFDSIEGQQDPILLSESFPWLTTPALAVLAFGRPSQSMSVSDPQGPFQRLAREFQNARVQYVKNLRIELDGLNMEPQERQIFYSKRDNLLFIDTDKRVGLRDLDRPLTLLFKRDDYLTPVRLWLKSIEEETPSYSVQDPIPIDVALAKLDELGINQIDLEELFQVLGGRTQQIIRSVASALFALCCKGETPISVEEFRDTIGKIVDSGNPRDQAEQVVFALLDQSGVSSAAAQKAPLVNIASSTRDAYTISKKSFDLFGIDLCDWNHASELIDAGQMVRNEEALQLFSSIKQEYQWTACGFLQANLKNKNKREFIKLWESYDAVQPDPDIHLSWSPQSSVIVNSLIDWFRDIALNLLDADMADVFDHGDPLSQLKNQYEGKDPELVRSENLEAIGHCWSRFRIVLACLSFRQPDNEPKFNLIRQISEDTPGQWIAEQEDLFSIFSVMSSTDEEIYGTLCRWLGANFDTLRTLIEGKRARTIDELIRSSRITEAEKEEAKERLASVPKVIPKQKVAGKSLEIPEQEENLYNLRNQLEALLGEDSQRLLNELSKVADITNLHDLDDVPAPQSRRRTGRGTSTPTNRNNRNFVGYVGEFLVYKALKKRYPFMKLSNWVSENKLRFYRGMKGNDSLGYDFRLPMGDKNVLIEVKTHTRDQIYFDFGSSELHAAQEALESGDDYQVWVLRNLEDEIEIDRVPNPMDRRQKYRLDIGRVYYRTK